MKRSRVIKSLVAILKTWESCKLDENCANDLLTKLEQINLIHPTHLVDKGLYGSELVNGWEPEGDSTKE